MMPDSYSCRKTNVNEWNESKLAWAKPYKPYNGLHHKRKNTSNNQEEQHSVQLSKIIKKKKTSFVFIDKDAMIPHRHAASFSKLIKAVKRVLLHYTYIHMGSYASRAKQTILLLNPDGDGVAIAMNGLVRVGFQDFVNIFFFLWSSFKAMQWHQHFNSFLLSLYRTPYNTYGQGARCTVHSVSGVVCAYCMGASRSESFG